MTNRVLREFVQDAGLGGLAQGSPASESPAPATAVPGIRPPLIEFADGCLDTGPGAALPSRLPVTELATGAVAAAGYAASMLGAARNFSAPADVRVDPASVAASFRGEHFLRVDGRAPRPFAELSGFFRARDGWVRTHANYPHHRDRLLEALDLTPGADRAAVAARLQTLDAADVENRTQRAGGIAVAVRTADEWCSGAQYAALAGEPLTGLSRIGNAPRRLLSPTSAGSTSAGSVPAGPASGLRVLDLTRVIAGPVAGRTLAWLGAEVLRVDSPRLPELGWQHLATGAGKRSTLLDLDEPRDRCRFDHLVGEADVVLLGYRSAAMARLGLEPDELVERNPGLVVGRLTAWGDNGPWAGARGFDSIVQAASGIARREADGDEPGALPAQALDHASGYLLAAGVLAAVAWQLNSGGSWRVDCRLARTAAWLLETEPAHTPGTQTPAPGGGWDLAARLTDADTPSGVLTMARPAVHIDGVPDHFSGCGRKWGVDAARWLDDE